VRVPEVSRAYGRTCGRRRFLSSPSGSCLDRDGRWGAWVRTLYTPRRSAAATRSAASA